MHTDSKNISRRQMLRSVSSGLGYLAFAALAHQQAVADSADPANPLAPKAPHFPAKAKRVIFLTMRGAPSHVDLLDYKPQLQADSGKPSPFGRFRGAQLMGSQWKFKQYGQSGLWISDLLPNIARQADELCVLNGMYTDVPNHAPASIMSHTGSFQFVRPSIGAWTLYGLGTENANLPGFIALNPPAGSAPQFGSAFLPAVYQADRFGAGAQGFFSGRYRQSQTTKVDNIKNPFLDEQQQRLQLDFMQTLNERKLRKEEYQPDVEGVIQSFELAFRMQDELPQLMSLEDESESTLKLYGVDGSETDAFGRQCLLARRMSEAGVRFVELSHQNWDHHRGLSDQLPQRCQEIDKPIAGLIQDLRQRNLLDETLIVWAGEFGRTPYSQGSDGRDHNNKGYTTFMVGGGVRGGLAYGSTDDYGYEAVDGKVHIHDWHATILHLLGLDHEKLTYRHAGRDFRLTDVKGRVVTDIVA